MKVVAFEPSPDTATLLKRSIRDNGFDGKKGSIQIVQAAAAEWPGFGRLVRHRDSPGMTILQRNGDSSSLPFGVMNIIADGIPLVRPESSLANIISSDVTSLQLLKVDAEGHELHAFRGVNLERFPFRFVTFELFPELLWKAGHTDPLDLLNYINSFGYICAAHPKSLQNEKNLLRTSEEIQTWYKSTVVPAYKKSPNFHLNLYCFKGDKV
jgi:FkbM family methyltransferase